jgi:hypothetical protein
MSRMGRVRVCGVLSAGAVVVAVTGCTSTVAGVAVRDPGAGPANVRPLLAAQLDGVLLSIAQLNEVMGATKMEVVLTGQEMSDNSEAVSDPDCLGSIFGAEDTVYQGSAWTAVRDQVAREPRDDNDHWVEQSAVLYPSEQRAADFVENSASAWKDCGGFSVAVNDGTTSSIWLIDEVKTDDDVITQMISQEDSDGWECQHAMSAAANLSVETIACAFGVHDEAVTMVDKMMANAATR